jgi:hypothetical protein
MEMSQQTGEKPELHIDSSLVPSLHVDGVGLGSKHHQEHLTRFFESGWWTRLWTVQEYVFARSAVFQCGTRLLNGEVVQKGLKNIIAHFMFTGCCEVFAATTLPNSFADALNSIVYSEYCRRTTTKDSFLAVLSHFSMRDATDIRDKTYGWLGLSTAEYLGRIKVDYTESPEQIFEAAALAAIEETRTLEVFGHLYGERKLSLLSFVPDWTGNFNDQSDYHNRIRNLQLIMHLETEHRRLIISQKGQYP